MGGWNRLGKLATALWLLAVLGVLATGCQNRKKVYNPYESEEIPAAFFEGRAPSRFVAVSEMDAGTAATLAARQTPAPLPVVQDKSDELMAMLDASQASGYRLGAGDVLEIIYQLKSVLSEEAYRLETQDGLRIAFLYTPKLDADVFVRTDGKVNLPLVGDVPAAGRTTEELRQQLVELYSKTLRDPVIQVFVTRSNNAIEELKRAITTAPRGQSRLTPVRPDGYISLPLIGEVRAANRTVEELSHDIVEMYARANVQNIDVTVVLLEVKAPVVYVLGDVANPGPITMVWQTDLWRAIGLAGGITESGDRAAVTLVRSTQQGETRETYNFDRWLSGANPGENAVLRRGDVVHVPRLIGQYVYVLGEVEKPGRVKLERGETLHASQALSLGGRILTTGRQRQVLVLSRAENGEPMLTEVDLRAIVRPRNYDHPEDYPPRDPILKPGDVVYVPTSPVGDFNHFAANWFRNGIWAVVPFNVVYNLN
ncbi:MAG: polysaccharide biosynthesis/export family protein [Candidatus Sumerlaeia bacterium]|nr:polysaccharide biosynthesis/export family protein [Candidatus Sumerlaeia bacterium]